MKYILPPLDAVTHVLNPTVEQRILQHARWLEIALEQEDVAAAICELNLMLRLYHEYKAS